jgi:hypothetical protein
MSSVKDISEALLKIAYADKSDRIEMIAQLAKDFQSVPYSEIPQVQHDLIKEIFKDLNQEVSNDKTQKPTGTKKPVKDKATKAVAVQKQLKLSNLKEGDMFTFVLSQEDLEMGVDDVVYTFDAKRGSTYFYKGDFGIFHISENREVNLVTEPVVLQPKIIEVVEPKVVVEEPQVIVPTPVPVTVRVPAPVPKPVTVPKPKRTPKVKPAPKPVDDLSFLDDIDNAF